MPVPGMELIACRVIGGEKNEVAGLDGIGLQMCLIDAASLLDQRKFRLLVPVCRDSRVRIRKLGDILLERKHLFPVFLLFPFAPVPGQRSLSYLSSQICIIQFLSAQI